MASQWRKSSSKEVILGGKIEILSTDILLQILSNLNVFDLSCVSSTNRRFCYLVHQFQTTILGPELVAHYFKDSDYVHKQETLEKSAYKRTRMQKLLRSSLLADSSSTSHNFEGDKITYACDAYDNEKEMEEISEPAALTIESALRKIQTPPNVAFCFYTPSVTRNRSSEEKIYLPKQIHKLLPEKTVVLGSMSQYVQANVGQSVDYKSQFGVLLGSFRGQSTFLPFYFDNEQDSDSEHAPDEDNYNIRGNNNSRDNRSSRRRRSAGNNSDSFDNERTVKRLHIKLQSSNPDPSYWRLFIVYVCGDGYNQADGFISKLQQQYPSALVIGGLCDGGHIRFPSEYNRRQQKQMKEEQEQKMLDNLKSKTTRELRKLIHEHTGKKVSEDQILRESSSRDEKEILINLAMKSMQYTSQVNSVFCTISHGVIGLAIGGSVPVKAVVSRGVRSLTSPPPSNAMVSMPTSQSNVLPTTHDCHNQPLNSVYQIVESTLLNPSHPNYPFYMSSQSSHVLKPVHMVRTVRNTRTNEVIDVLQLLMRIASTVKRPEFVGLKRQQYNNVGQQHHSHNTDHDSITMAQDQLRQDADDNEEDGFELTMISRSLFVGECMVFMADPERPRTLHSHEGSYFDLFVLDGEACIDDVNNKLYSLKQHLEDCQKKVLGGIMFSCAGRGPCGGELLGSEEEMVDARCFHRHFPHVPCLGYYAGGEIGPKALAKSRNFFRSGRAAVQGFTAVFALFIVPDVKDWRRLDDNDHRDVEKRNGNDGCGMKHVLDDSEEIVAGYMEKRLRFYSDSSLKVDDLEEKDKEYNK